MNYIVIELQTDKGSTATIATAFSDSQQAYQKYHTILAAAAVSEVETHAACILSERGSLIAYECFSHEPEPEVVSEDV